MTHISYECAKKLKDFLKESAPEPIKSEMGQVWLYDMECPDDGILQGVSLSETDAPAYQLHDLLSKKFCEAMAKAITHPDEMRRWDIYRDGNDPGEKISPAERLERRGEDISRKLWHKNYHGGLPAVEKALCEMMEGK